MNCYTTYILYSTTKNKYYVGHTNNITRRLTEHNSGQNKSTKLGSPWELVYTKEFDSKSDAYQSEIKIKNRGASRFLSDTEING